MERWFVGWILYRLRYFLFSTTQLVNKGSGACHTKDPLLLISLSLSLPLSSSLPPSPLFFSLALSPALSIHLLFSPSFFLPLPLFLSPSLSLSPSPFRPPPSLSLSLSLSLFLSISVSLSLSLFLSLSIYLSISVFPHILHFSFSPLSNFLDSNHSSFLIPSPLLTKQNLRTHRYNNSILLSGETRHGDIRAYNYIHSQMTIHRITAHAEGNDYRQFVGGFKLACIHHPV